MNTNLPLLIAAGALVGAASGYLGSFMVLKRMSLVGDALSHVALPGMAIAMMLSINPMIGAFVALSMAIVGIWYLSEHSEIYPEALVGVFFTASLSIGILITPEPELFEALFGDIEKVTRIDAIMIFATTVLIFILTKLISKKLMLGIVSEDLARTSGTDIPRINLIYLLLVGLVVALGVKFVGTLLTGALIIIPAVTAKNIAKSVKGFQVLSTVIGIFSVISGVIISRMLSISSGPAVVIVGVILFIGSYFFKRAAD